MTREVFVTYDHVAVVTLVGDEGVVGDGVEHHAPERRVGGRGAGHSCSSVLVSNS